MIHKDKSGCEIIVANDIAISNPTISWITTQDLHKIGRNKIFDKLYCSQARRWFGNI